MRRWERILRRHHVFMEKRESFGHHRWVYVKILFSAAGKKDVFEKKNILCSFDLVRISRGVSRASVVRDEVVFLCARVLLTNFCVISFYTTQTHRLRRRVATFRGEQNCRQRYPNAKSYFSRSVCDCITFARISARAWND